MISFREEMKCLQVPTASISKQENPNLYQTVNSSPALNQ